MDILFGHDHSNSLPIKEQIILNLINHSHDWIGSMYLGKFELMNSDTRINMENPNWTRNDEGWLDI